MHTFYEMVFNFFSQNLVWAFPIYFKRFISHGSCLHFHLDLCCHFHFRIFKIVYKIKVTWDFKTPTLEYEENVKLIMNSM